VGRRRARECRPDGPGMWIQGHKQNALHIYFQIQGTIYTQPFPFPEKCKCWAVVLTLAS
jgi:hypothetical protein